MNLKRLFAFVTVLLISIMSFAQNPWNGKVVLQGFWWDYWNNNYPNAWADYLTELSPRLRDLGIDMVWIPPTSKNGGTNSNGYSPFDHYDLGDKYQKGSTTTRFGNKDQFLRMVAVMKANGLGVVQDIVLNHIDNAGSASGQGGQDPAAWDDYSTSRYKNFRYVSYNTPASAETAANYLARNGRFSKNWQNFHPNSAHNSVSGDWNAVYWGPDLCYYDGATGLSSNATYNPAQSSQYIRVGMRNWLIWLKKQTGVDGFRIDAVKHFPHWAMEDFLYNLQVNAGWASGGSQMFAVGEWVGSKGELDSWANNVQNRAGTFDFSLRQALKDMVSAGGSYDLGSIPGAQQNNRTRTVPFVNNHDTFRPIKNASGNYIGWDSGNELGGGHIDPFDPRLAVSYAIMMAVDGSPQVFFEDLFNVGSTGKRLTHKPTNTTDLPVRDDIANIIWAHQKLNFKQGAYKVRWQSQDALVIERSNRAIIAVNDNWSTWQTVTIQTDFGPNRQLHDYSGANSGSVWTNSNGQVTLWIPPCDGSNIRRGYAIWGPAGITGGFSPGVNSVTQEWELSDDLGDSHASSLKQGGSLPAASTALRTAGRIFVESGKTITANLFPSVTTRSHVLNIYNNAGSIVRTVTGTGTLTATYVAPATGYYTLRARHNSSSSAPKETVWIKATYTAPRTVTVASFPKVNDDFIEEIAVEETEIETPESFVLAQNYPNPFNPSTMIRFSIPADTHVKLVVTNLLGQEIRVLENRELSAGSYEKTFDATGLSSGVYLYQIITPQGSLTGKMILSK